MTPEKHLTKARPRKTEIVLWWAVGISILLHVFLLAVHYYHIDLTSLLLLALIMVIVLLVLTRKKPPFNAHDAVQLCKKQQYKYVKQALKPHFAEVQPTGKYWIVDFTRDAIAFTVDPIERYIIGFRVKSADEIVTQTERSQILRTAAQRSIQQEAEKEALSAAGFDTSDLETKNEEE